MEVCSAALGTLCSQQMVHAGRPSFLSVNWHISRQASQHGTSAACAQQEMWRDPSGASGA